MTTWWQRRRNRLDMAVLGSIALGNHFYTDIEKHIGGNSSRIYPALERLVRLGLIDLDVVTSGEHSGRTAYCVSMFGCTQIRPSCTTCYDVVRAQYTAHNQLQK